MASSTTPFRLHLQHVWADHVGTAATATARAAMATRNRAASKEDDTLPLSSGYRHDSIYGVPTHKGTRRHHERMITARDPYIHRGLKDTERGVRAWLQLMVQYGVSIDEVDTVPVHVAIQQVAKRMLFHEDHQCVPPTPWHMKLLQTTQREWEQYADLVIRANRRRLTIDAKFDPHALSHMIDHLTLSQLTTQRYWHGVPWTAFEREGYNFLHLGVTRYTATNHSSAEWIRAVVHTWQHKHRNESGSTDDHMKFTLDAFSSLRDHYVEETKDTSRTFAFHQLMLDGYSLYETVHAYASECPTLDLVARKAQHHMISFEQWFESVRDEFLTVFHGALGPEHVAALQILGMELSEDEQVLPALKEALTSQKRIAAEKRHASRRRKKRHTFHHDHLVRDPSSVDALLGIAGSTPSEHPFAVLGHVAPRHETTHLFARPLPGKAASWIPFGDAERVDALADYAADAMRDLDIAAPLAAPPPAKRPRRSARHRRRRQHTAASAAAVRVGGLTPTQAAHRAQQRDARNALWDLARDPDVWITTYRACLERMMHQVVVLHYAETIPEWVKQQMRALASAEHYATVFPPAGGFARAEKERGLGSWLAFLRQVQDVVPQLPPDATSVDTALTKLFACLRTRMVLWMVRAYRQRDVLMLQLYRRLSGGPRGTYMPYGQEGSRTSVPAGEFRAHLDAHLDVMRQRMAEWVKGDAVMLKEAFHTIEERCLFFQEGTESFTEMLQNFDTWCRYGLYCRHVTVLPIDHGSSVADLVHAPRSVVPESVRDTIRQMRLDGIDAGTRAPTTVAALPPSPTTAPSSLRYFFQPDHHDPAAESKDMRSVCVGSPLAYTCVSWVPSHTESMVAWLRITHPSDHTPRHDVADLLGRALGRSELPATALAEVLTALKQNPVDMTSSLRSIFAFLKTFDSIRCLLQTKFSTWEWSLPPLVKAWERAWDETRAALDQPATRAEDKRWWKRATLLQTWTWILDMTRMVAWYATLLRDKDTSTLVMRSRGLASSETEWTEAQTDRDERSAAAASGVVGKGKKRSRGRRAASGSYRSMYSE